MASSRARRRREKRAGQQNGNGADDAHSFDTRAVGE